MLQAIQNEEYQLSDYIKSVCHESGDISYSIDYMSCNVLMFSVEVSLVNAMSREQILKIILQDMKADYDFILLEAFMCKNGIKKYKGSCIAMAGCVLLNMPFAIKWLVLFITNQIE